MKNYFPYLLVAVLLVFSLGSCDKDELPENPFDNDNPTDSTTLVTLEANSIEGLYKNVFKPTCANSGCHDGTFEPDFRTIESTYYSLVYHEIIKQNPSNLMDYRVLPGNANQSILMERLTVDIGGNSGIMPLVIEPGSDWPDKSVEYIQNVRDWINNGAKDVFGNPTQGVNFKPQLLGCAITPAGSLTTFPRDVKGIIQIPPGTGAIDIYIAIEDKETVASAYSLNDLQLSRAADDFSLAIRDTLVYNNAVNFIGYSDVLVPFYHKITISNPYSIWSQNEAVFMNVLVDDGDNGVVGLPGIYSMEHLINYYSFTLK